jgi:formylglycine-generating enzyme required for sulfatase activity
VTKEREMKASEKERGLQAKGLWSDREITRQEEDRFGSQDYAAVLADRAATADTPLTLGIFGPWGSGKTSLMQLMRAFLPQQTKTGSPLHSIWINVWQLSNQDQVWQAFLQAIFSAVNCQLHLWQRIDIGKLMRQLFSNSYRIVLVITPMILGALIARPEAGWGDVLKLLLNPIAGAGTLLTVGLGLWTLVKPMVEAARQVVNFDLQAVLKYAPYEVQITELMQLQNRFGDMVRALVGKQGRLVVFIDDLDRCAPDKVPDVLEAIKLFTTTPNCVYVLGLDHDIVRQGISAKYHFEREEDATDYLEKIVQIPFHLPPLDEGRMESFVRDYYPDLQQICSTAPDVFSQGLEPNPRKVKRALNIYRTLWELAEVRVKAWEMDPVDAELVAKMVVIESRFRALHQYLVKEPAFLPRLEAKALEGDGLNSRALAEDAEIGYELIGKPKTGDSEAKSGLIDVASLGALRDLLCAGKKHFTDADQRSLISSYIYLIATTQGVEQLRPTRREREALLGGDLDQIRARVADILRRGANKEDQQRIAQGYIERLEGVQSDPDRYTAAERESAGRALMLLVLGGDLDQIRARVADILRRGADKEDQQRIAQGYIERLEGVQSDPDRYTAAERESASVALVLLVLGGDLDQIRTRVAEILGRGANKEAQQEITQGYIERLEGVQSDSDRYTPAERKSASVALVLLKPPPPPETVRVPAGTFLLGDESKAGESLQRTLSLPDYSIGKYPVTNAEYQAFALDTWTQRDLEYRDYLQDKSNHPVVGVSWDAALAYCQWLSEKTGEPYRLPSEAEWEKAARGTDGRIYPWGNELPDANRCNFADSARGTTPVGQYSPQGDSPYGCADMAGNVWEWCYSGNEPSGTPVLRGGAFGYDAGRIRCAYRLEYLPGDGLTSVGFRVVLAPGSR